MAGLNILTLGSGKTYTNMVALGISNMRVSGTTVYFTVAATGEEVSVTLPAPADGISITNVEVNASKELIITLSDNTKVNAGVVPTVKGDKGDKLTFNDLTEAEKESLKGDDGFNPIITENAGNTDKIYKLDITTADTTFTTPNLKGADGQGGSGGSGEENVIESIKVNGVAQTVAADKSVDITVPEAYDDTSLVNRVKAIEDDYAKTSDIPSLSGYATETYVDNKVADYTKTVDLADVATSGSYNDLADKPIIPSLDGYAKTSEIPSKVSELENDSNYLSSIPEEYVTETELSAKGYLTEHQDISGKVDKVEGKSLISDAEIARLATVDNYDDIQVKTAIQAVANGLMDSVGYSADYKTIDIIAKNGVKKSVNVAPIISHASITELSDVDTTNKASGKALVYNATTSKHEYADVSGTDEKVKMDSSTDAKYLGELLDNVTITNENGKLKVKKLDGQEVTITEINYLKGLTMNVMDLVNMFSNGGVKIINTPVATYAELLAIDKSSFIEGISYLVYVLADENHDNAKTTYLVDKDSETPTYFGFADSQRDFTTNPIDLATEITGKLGIANMDSDAIKALFTVDDTYKTETATNNAFSTHGAKALYDELLLAIGNKANSSDLTAHKDDTDIHVSTEDRTKWDSAKTHADSAHAPSNAQENVLETVKVNGTALEVSDKAVNVTVPTTVAELTDSSSYAKKTDIPTTLPANGGNASTVNGHTVNSDVPENAKFTDTTYSDATQIEHGLMSVDDKKKLDGLTKYTPDGSTITADEDGTLHGQSVDIMTVDKAGIGKPDGDTIEVSTDATISVSSKALTFADHDTATSGTSFTDAEDGNMIVTDWTKNLLNPTLETCEQNGVTCTRNVDANGKPDGTYTLNGTATANAYFTLEIISKFEDKIYKIVSFKNATNKFFSYINAQSLDGSTIYSILTEYGIPTGYISKNKYKSFDMGIAVISGTTLTNEILKPMLTTDLSATYDDFVPYGGYEIRSCGKNLFDNVEIITNTMNIEAKLTDDAGIKLNGTTPYDPNWKDVYVECQATKLEKGKTYCLSVKDALDGLYIILRRRNSSNAFKELNLHNRFIIFTWDKDDEYIRYTLTVKSQQTFDNVTIYPQLEEVAPDTTEPTDFEPYTGETITVTNETESPAFGLKSHKGITNIISPGNVKCVYPTNESGKGVLDSLYNKDKMLTEQNKNLEVLGKCKNLLNPTLQTTTKNGVTCTNNGDGTYTIDSGGSPATADCYFILNSNFNLESGKSYRIIGNPGYPNGGSSGSDYRLDFYNGATYFGEYGGGTTVTGGTTNKIQIIIAKGVTVSNLIFKPMLTTNLNATYDDFVPYTGDGDTLTHDVAKLNDSLGSTDISAIGDGTVTGAISTMNDSLKQIGNCELIKEVSGSTSYNWNIKDISKYSWLTFSYSNNFITIPYLVFKTVGSCIVKLGSISNNENLKATFTYVSDTNITISASQGSMVRLFGIK